MKEITMLMINEFKIKQLGYDFMGYSLQKGDIYTFHHLIIPRRHGGAYSRDNGAILFSTPHSYLHIIEAHDYDRFTAITSEMIDMNIKGYLDVNNLMFIDDILKSFEKEYINKTTRKGKKLIKDNYLNRNKFKKN